MPLSKFVTFTLHPHSNADTLSVAKIDGTDWQCIVRTQDWSAGCRGIYIAIDALLDPARPYFAFLQKTATKKFEDGRPGHRIKTIRLRGALSQGLLIPPPEGSSDVPAGELDKFLGIERYEPPIPVDMRGEMIRSPGAFALLPHAENAKNYPTMFAEGDPVRVSEKIHGSSFRVALVDDGRVEGPIYIVGSHTTAKSTDGTNLYSRIARELVSEQKLRAALAAHPYKFSRNFILFGEVYGYGVQDLQYGCGKNVQKLRLFDVMIDDRFQPLSVILGVAEMLDLETVPLLYEGPFDKAKVLALRDGPTTMPGATHLREGVVVTADPEEIVSVYEEDGSLKYQGRKTLKYISDDYLERSGAKDGH